MTSRERVYTALAHKQPDRCPADLWLEPTTLKKVMEYFGVEKEEEIYDILQIDFQLFTPDSTLPESKIQPDGSWYDHMGVQYHMVKNEFCEYTECISHPLAFVEDVEDFEQYDKWPDATTFDWEHLSEKIGDAHEKRVIKLHAGGLYEVAWTLRGQEQFLIDMAINPEIAHYIMKKLCDYWCDYIQFALDAAGDKIDMVYTYDDIATQATLLMSPEMLEEFIYPYHRRVNAVIRKYGKEIIYHSCGSIISQIDQLCGLPIDILNPLQPKAAGMNFSVLKDTWGDSLCFLGGIDIQYTLPRGSVEEVQKEVKRAVSILGKEGGYILASAHYIQNDTPVENIIAMYDPLLR